MTQAEVPTARAAPGRRLRFVARPTDAPPADPNVDVIVLDTAWTPTSEDRVDLRPVRATLHELLGRLDLFNQTQERLDGWAATTNMAERMTADGVSWWFQLRMRVRWDLHERMIWCHVLDALLDGRHVVIEVPGERVALVDAAQAAARSRPNVVVDVIGSVAGTASRRPAKGRTSAAPATGWAAPMAGMRRLARGGKRTVRRLLGLPTAPSRRTVASRLATLDERLDRLIEEPGGALSIASARFFQVIHVNGQARFVDPHLALVLDRLAADGVPIMTVALALSHASDRDWSQLEADDRLVPSTVVAGRWGRPEDDAIDASDVVARLAEVADVPLVVAGCDLGPALHALLIAAGRAALESQRRWLRVAERLIHDLRPRVLFVDHEGVRTLWLAAARRSGMPSVAVQHGVIYANNPEYCHPRLEGLMLPDLTCVFGTYERDLLLTLGGYQPHEVIVTGSSRADPERSSRIAAPDERADVRRELGVRDVDRLLVVSVAHNPVAGDIYSVEMVARLLGGPLPGIHVVFKLHPRERSDAPYEAVLTGLARANGYPPPAMTSVRDADLYRLLRSADAHLGLHSTVLTDAVVAGTPNLIAVGQAFSDMLGYIPARVAVPVASVEEVRAFMRDPRAPEAADREAFLALHFQPGDATGRIVTAIRSLLDKPSVRVRPVEAGDAATLLGWANDPATRRMSFNPERIEPEPHGRWLDGRLASSTTRFFIGIEGDRPVGQVRFERGPDDEVEISISVAPEARGRGLGRQLLLAGMTASQQEPALGGTSYVARVRPENQASIDLFEGCGFARRQDGDDGAPVGSSLVFELGLVS